MDSDIDWITAIIFLIQFFLINPICAVMTLKKYKPHIEIQKEVRDEKKARTAKGRIKLKVEKKVQKEMPILAVKKMNEFMEDPSSEDDSSSDYIEIPAKIP